MEKIMNTKKDTPIGLPGSDLFDGDEHLAEDDDGNIVPSASLTDFEAGPGASLFGDEEDDDPDEEPGEAVREMFASIPPWRGGGRVT
jgi:hypothetical protein